MATIAERIRAGMAWLDEHKPGWVDMVDTGSALDMGDEKRCLLGQLFGHFCNVSHAHPRSHEPSRYAHISGRMAYGAACDLGFAAGNGRVWVGDGEYESMTRGWKRYIRERRNQDAAKAAARKAKRKAKSAHK